MRPRSRAHIGVDFDQVDDGAVPNGRFNVSVNTKVPTSPSPWPPAGSFRRLQVDPGPGYWPGGAADIFDIATGYQQRSASEPGPRRRSSFSHSVAPASLYLAGAS